MTEYQGSAQQKADKKYREKVAADEQLKKERNKKTTFRTAKSYIRNHADLEGLAELKQLIAEKEAELKKSE